MLSVLCDGIVFPEDYNRILLTCSFWATEHLNWLLKILLFWPTRILDHFTYCYFWTCVITCIILQYAVICTVASPLSWSKVFMIQVLFFETNTVVLFVNFFKFYCFKKLCFSKSYTIFKFQGSVTLRWKWKCAVHWTWGNTK